MDAFNPLIGTDSVRLHFPQTPADFFGILALGDSEAGLDATLARIDPGAADLGHVYRLVHRRTPGSINALASGSTTGVLAHLRGAILSDEFQENVIAHLLAAFPALQRVFLLDTSAAAGLARCLPYHLPLDPALADMSKTSKPALLRALADIVRLIPQVDGFAVAGATTLGDLQQHIRLTDRLVALIADPIDIMVANANRAIASVLNGSRGTVGDAGMALQGLMPIMPPPISPKGQLDRAMQALRDPLICPPDPLCRLLSTGAADYVSAINTIALYDIELVDGERIAAWAAAAGGDAPVPPAAGPLTRAAALQAAGDHLRATVMQDAILHEVVRWALERRHTASLRGGDLLRDAGRLLLDDPPRRSPRPGGKDGAARPGPVVAVGAQAVIDYLAIHQRIAGAWMHLTFGTGGNAHAMLAHGWSAAEPGYVWTNDVRAGLRLPRPPEGTDLLLRLQAKPFVADDRLPSQEMAIIVNGERLCTSRLSEQVVIEVHLNRALLALADRLAIDFELPDATRPADLGGSDDIRRLGVNVRELLLIPMAEAGAVGPDPAEDGAVEVGAVGREAVGGDASGGDKTGADKTGADLAGADPTGGDPTGRELMARFESLGENCEFGLVQRRCGAEPLGLLRFASAPLPKLLPALRAGFADLGRPDLIEVQVSSNGREYMVLDRRYGFFSHAWVLVGEKGPEEVHRRECRRLPFLTRKLLEDLRDGEKIFVFHGMSPLSLAEARALEAALAAYGKACLLWVEAAGPDDIPGSVRHLGGRLLRGVIDRFAPGDNAHDLSLACWKALCRNALQAAAKLGGPSGEGSKHVVV